MVGPGFGIRVLPIGPQVVPFYGLYVESYKVISKRNYLGAYGYRLVYPKGPSFQIVGFQGPKTAQRMDFGTSNLIIWVLGPSKVERFYHVSVKVLKRAL